MLQSIFLFYLIFFLIVALVKCDYINVTFSATNITVNGSFEITLLGFEPNPGSYPTITCASSFPTGASFLLLRYNFPRKAFDLGVSLAAYEGRVRLKSDHRAEISPVKFTDERKTFQCTFSHFIGVRPVTLRSKAAMIENVYGKYCFYHTLKL